MAQPNPPFKVLVIDDEADLRELVSISLLRMGLEVETAASVTEGIAQLQRQSFDLALTDMRLPDGTGLDILAYIHHKHLDIPTAVITAYGSADNAVEALKAGAFDYVSKPLQLEHLRTLVKSALAIPNKEGNRQAPSSASASAAFLGQSAAIEYVRTMVEKLAKSQAPVYITGESGSGKERAARMIHEQSNRAPQPFIAVNCGAIPENLMESEFFGHKKGAFTGADQERDGFFQAAHGGTLFLDEVADLPLAMQVKLLRAIQEKKVRKVGAQQEVSVDVRIISATHKSLAKCVEDGVFRQDLYYRLNVIELKMPSLREMRDDIALIATAILHKQAGPQMQLSSSALKALIEYDFPGNVRELENILERAAALCDGKQLTPEDLQLQPAVFETSYAEDKAQTSPPIGDKFPLQDYLDRVEKEAIIEALEQTRYNRTAAARILGVTFRSLRYRLERLGIE